MSTLLFLRGPIAVITIAILAGCAGYGGSKLVPGSSRLEDVTLAMGPPALQWREADGSLRLAYPHGPLGMTTTMVSVAGDGTLRRIENVLDEEHFAAVENGTTDREGILRMFGPPREMMDWDRRNEQTWEWRFRDAWKSPSLFIVVFDRSTWKVKQTMQLREITRRHEM